MALEQEMTADEQQQWIKEQYQVATKYLATQGLVTQSVVAEASRYLIPFISIWKLKVLDGSYFWVICGDLPSDHDAFGIAPNARDAIKYFSLKWQMQAENLLNTGDKDQEQFAKLLISRADGLYNMYQQDNVWDMK